MMWLDFVFLLIVAIQAAAGQLVSPWPVQVGASLSVNCWMKYLGGIKNLPGIDPLQIVHRVTLKVGDGLTYATFYDPNPNRTDFNYRPFTEKCEVNTSGFEKFYFLTGGDGDYRENAQKIFIIIEINKAECHDVTDYTCSFEYFTNYTEKRSATQSFSKETKKFKPKTNISPNPVILGHPMTVTCSDSANNDDLNVTVVNIQLFVKHGESFKRLVSYIPNESLTPSNIKYGQFQLPGVTNKSFKANVNKTDGKPRYYVMMKVDSALRDHVAVYKCQYDVIMQNGCTKTEQFIVDENVTAECEDFRFGSKCSKICHCNNASEICDKVTGQCLSGCKPEWTGVDCQTAANTVPQDCSGDLCGNHNCEVKEGVATCLCLPGYMNSGPLHCHDIDECKKHHDICHNHTCVNTNGSYSCECLHGYHNIGPKTCVHDDTYALKQSDFLNLETIQPQTVVLAIFCTTLVTFASVVTVLCARTVGSSIYRFATTKPAKGFKYTSTRCHHIIVTKLFEDISTAMYHKADDTSTSSSELTSPDLSKKGSTRASAAHIKSSTVNELRSADGSNIFSRKWSQLSAFVINPRDFL